MAIAKLNSLILQHLKKVSPNLVIEFQTKFECPSSQLNLKEIDCMRHFILDHAIGLNEHHLNKRRNVPEANSVKTNSAVSEEEFIDLVSSSDFSSRQSDSDSDDDMPNDIYIPPETAIIEIVSSNRSSSSSESVSDDDIIEVDVQIKNSNQREDLNVNKDTEEELYFVKELEKQFKCYQSLSSDFQSDSDPDDDTPKNIYIPPETAIIDIVSSNSESFSDDDIIEVDVQIKNSNQLEDLNVNRDTEEELDFVKELEKEFKCYQSLSSSSSSESDNELVGNTSEKTDNLIYQQSHDSELKKDVGKSQFILDCPEYFALQKDLKGDSIVDQIVLHILEKNIKISQLNFDHVILCKSRTRGVWNKNLYPKGVHIEKLSPQDSNIILSNWNALIKEMKIEHPKETFEKFYRRFSREDQLKANVLGLYLGQGLLKARLAADIFYHAEDKIMEFSKGKLSISERRIIKDYVEKHGDSLDAFTELTEILNRRDAYSVRRHYFYYKENEKMNKKGIPYSLYEEKLFIDALMLNFDIKSPTDIKNIKPKRSDVIFKEIAKTLGRHVISLRNHWEVQLKPLLLQYHAGTINLDIRRPLVNYLLEKNLRYMQDIKWSELLSYPHFDGHTELSLALVFSNIVTNVQRKHRCKGEEVTIEQMADWVNDRCNSHKMKTVENSALRRKLEIIDYYRKIVSND